MYSFLHNVYAYACKYYEGNINFLNLIINELEFLISFDGNFTVTEIILLPRTPRLSVYTPSLQKKIMKQEK